MSSAFLAAAPRGAWIERRFSLCFLKTRKPSLSEFTVQLHSSQREKKSRPVSLAATSAPRPSDTCARPAAESRVYVHLNGVPGSSGSRFRGKRKLENTGEALRLFSPLFISSSAVPGSYSVCHSFLKRFVPHALSSSCYTPLSFSSSQSSASLVPRCSVFSSALLPLGSGTSHSFIHSFICFFPSFSAESLCTETRGNRVSCLSCSRSFATSFSDSHPSLCPAPFSPLSVSSLSVSSLPLSSPHLLHTSPFVCQPMRSLGYGFSKSKRKADEARRQETARKAFFESMNQKSREEREREKEREKRRAEVQKQGPFLEGKDYYQILSVKRSASQEEIKKAYLEAAKRHHPDQNPDAPTEAAKRFQAVQQAYATLKKPWSRTLYDQELDGSFRNRRTEAMGREPGVGVRAEEKIWNENWEETAEQREQRRERYRRYAAGIREDLPYVDTINPVWIIAGTSAVVFGFAAYVNDRGKKSSDSALNDEFTDKDFQGDKLVRAFFNPFSAKWERLPDGFDPPAPHTLHTFYQKQYPNMKFDRDSLPANQLTLVKLPRSQTEPARLLVDKRTGETLWAHQIRSLMTNSSSPLSGSSAA